MLLGAVYEREVKVAPRTRGLFVARAVYCGTLLGIVATCWLVVTGSQTVATVGDTARFAATLLRILAPLQLVLAMLAAALTAVVAVGMEKDRRTLELLLLSRLTDAQLVLGKLAGSLLRVMLMLLSAVPIFAIAALFGGVTPEQLVRLFVATAAAALAAASIANAIAFWRDTTFQSLAITAFLLAAWVAAGEGLAARFGPEAAAILSPARAIFAAIEPAGGRTLGSFLAVCAGLIAASNGLAVARVRSWNTVGEPRRQQATAGGGASAPADTPAAPDGRGQGWLAPRERPVWRYPVFWREVCTRAHGRAMLLVRLAWLLLFAVAVAGVAAAARSPRPDRLAVAIAVVPMALASLLAVAAMAVTSITTERDRGTLDLLLVSDLEPGEFVWGKLVGVLVAAREIVLLPLLLCGTLVLLGIATPEHGAYLAFGLAVLLFFAAVLGLYAGLSHPASRQAIAVALGTVAFLFVGVATAMRIMVAFGASFELQLAPFLAVIVGGAVGIYAALSARNPSPAVGWASALLPALTFVAITGFLQGSTLQVFLVVCVAYGFATLALLVPAIGAFDHLTGRTTGE
jgi:ABC-type transport system involved in multi-copper enzyme maturation permease subunit